ncbi:hypothetical protein [Legionella maceachernii]|uniref:hypothetical protein n=1 Tax=Legionella maceachernii TaxID=466 RepID=UPI00135B7422|nr:hypothetical protein [Legionella maceachernii]
MFERTVVVPNVVRDLLGKAPAKSGRSLALLGMTVVVGVYGCRPERSEGSPW